MEKIEFDAKFGDDDKRIKIVANVKGGGKYQVYIDDYYQGDVSYKEGTWQAHINKRSILTGDDINILGELIEKNKDSNFPGGERYYCAGYIK